ncbi:MAG: arginase [Proteobacteria bacterium]|nr:arginase [Pseudomonadota bacterium]
MPKDTRLPRVAANAGWRPMHLEMLDLGAPESVRGLDASRWLSTTTLDLHDLAPALRLWSGARAIARARERLLAQPQRPDPVVTLVGSGDFHHLTPLLLERAREPLTLIHFDNHPDWVRLAPRWHCGSWVNQALRNPRVERIVTIGPCSDDLSWPGLKGGNLPALESGRLRLFPWSHAPSRVLRRVPDGPSWRYADGRLHWNNLAALSREELLRLILAQIATEAVWITIDKDVFPEDVVVSNWDQGQMPVQAVLDLIGAIVERHPLAGADICGDYAPPRFNNPIKRWEIARDQPRRPPPDALALARNAQVDAALLAALNPGAGRC